MFGESMLMKYKKITLFYFLALPACVLMRVLQLFFTVDVKTGFFKKEYSAYGLALLIFIAAVCAVCAFFCFTGHRNPARLPRVNPFLTAVSLAAAISTGIELFGETFAGTVAAWQTALLYITGLSAVVWFILYGVSDIGGIKLPPLLSVLPAFYLIVRIICTFTSVSSLALISDNILLLAAYCTALLFFLYTGRVFNDIQGDNNFRKLMVSGMASSILCVTQSVPHFVINIVSSGEYLHTSVIANIALLCLGLFIAAFTFSYFSAGNTEE